MTNNMGHTRRQAKEQNKCSRFQHVRSQYIQPVMVTIAVDSG